MTMHFYAETNIWNAMCDQAVDAKGLVTSLAAKDATLVISPHITYELARTFRGKRPTRDTQGIKLFSCMKAFLDLDMPCSKELMELLHEEAFAYEQGKTTVDPLLDAADRGTVSEEVNKLANGIVEGRVGEFIAKRTQHAKDTRAAQADHLTHIQATKTTLLQVPESQLSSWLTSQAITRSGAEILCSHLLRIFGPGPTPEYALALLNSPVGRA